MGAQCWLWTIYFACTSKVVFDLSPISELFHQKAANFLEWNNAANPGQRL